jgi:hypothetical protein
LKFGGYNFNHPLLLNPEERAGSGHDLPAGFAGRAITFFGDEPV